MNKIKTLTLAGLLGLIGFAGGFVNEAAAQAAVDRNGSDRAIIAIQPGDQGSERGIIAIKPGDQGSERGIIAVLKNEQPTDQNSGFVKDAYGDALGRKSGGTEQGVLIGLLKPADQNGITDGTMPTDQRSGFVQEAYGDALGRKAGEDQASGGGKKVWTGSLTLGSAATLGSLNGLGTTRDLFANSRGGDQGNGLLLPAVRKADGSVRTGDANALNFANGASGGGGGAGKTGDAKSSLNFTNNANNGAGAGPHVSPGAAKGLNFTVTAKK